MQLLSLLFGIVGLTLSISCSDAAYSPDEVIKLPGIPSGAPAFKQYSGYLNATGDKKFHYWFVESQSKPSVDPVVLWLNGGPGCSSMDGYLSENGPFHVNNDGATLSFNEYSWNKQASVIYLESPAGVGYSYSPSMDIKTSDNKTAEDNLMALQNFFVKFPEYVNNSFFIAGESYGGVYIPTLAAKIAQGNTSINLKGFAIGNGLLNYTNNMNSAVYYAYYHALIDQDLWTNLQTHCCQSGVCRFVNSSIPECQTAYEMTEAMVSESGINTYSIYRDCAGGIPTQSERYRTDIKTALGITYKLPQRKQSKIDGNSLYGATHFSSHGFHGNLGEDGLPCIDTTAEKTYLNRADVRKALHIPGTVIPWVVCSAEVRANYTKQYQSVAPLIQSLTARYPALFYNGDADIVCNFLGDQWFVTDLQHAEKTPRKTWTVDKQVAGFVHAFTNVTFATVKGAGHMVPQWRPAQAFYMISQFLKNLPL